MSRVKKNKEFLLLLIVLIMFGGCVSNGELSSIIDWFNKSVSEMSVFELMLVLSFLLMIFND